MKKEDTVDCVCKNKIKEKDFIPHVKTCSSFKHIYGPLCEILENSFKAAKDDLTKRVLQRFLMLSANTIEVKAQANPGSPVHAQNPPPPQAPQQPPAPLQPQPQPQPQPQVASDKKDNCIDSNSIFCKSCNTHFLDFNLIMYLENCCHTICKNCLKKKIVKYLKSPKFNRELPEEGFVKCYECSSQLIDQEMKVF